MAEQYLMKRGTSESMNVPAAKLQEYLDDNWIVVEKTSVDAPAAEKAAAGEVAETPKQRRARETAEKAAAGEQTPPEEEPKG